MAGRVTDAAMYNKGQDAMNRTREKMVKNQEQSVTGLRVNRPSDDPVAAMRALGIKAADKRNEQISTNMQMGRSILSLADSSLSEMNELLSRGKELAIQMSSSSNATEDSRVAVANEVEQLQLRAVQIANSRFGDRYIFGGYQTERAPFDEKGNYYGDSGQMEFEIDRAQKMPITVSGSAAFMGMKDLPPEADLIRQDPQLDTFPSVDVQPLAQGRTAGPTPASVDEKGGEKGDALYGSHMPSLAGVNVFAVLRDFSEALRTGDRVGINNSIDGLDKGFQQVLETRTLVGARLNVMDSGINSADNARVTNAERLSEVQDADTLKVFSDLAKNEHALNASMQTSSKLITHSLLDFLK